MADTKQGELIQIGQLRIHGCKQLIFTYSAFPMDILRSYFFAKIDSIITAQPLLKKSAAQSQFLFSGA